MAQTETSLINLTALCITQKYWLTHPSVVGSLLLKSLAFGLEVCLGMCLAFCLEGLLATWDMLGLDDNCFVT